MRLPISCPSAGSVPTADTLEAACLAAINDERWDDGEENVDTLGETHVTGIWEGKHAAYSGPEIDIPEAFLETVQHKADLFDDLIALLREPARSMGLSRDEFEEWLPRALYGVGSG